jgi:hypothetical protein
MEPTVSFGTSRITSGQGQVSFEVVVMAVEGQLFALFPADTT